MKAIQYSSYDGIDAMALVETARPSPGPGEVLVKVRAAGVNPVDLAVSDGHLKDFMPLAFPITAGGELSGVVEAVGDGVTGFTPGDEVHTVTGVSGAFAEYALCKAAGLVRKPKSMSFEEAAGLPVAAATATSALNVAEVGPGTRLLVHAAAGGVGSVAVQIAKARGAYVTALASAGNMAFVQALGADEVVDRASRYEDTLRDFDVVLDAFGPEAQARSWPTLKKGGMLASLVTVPSEEEAATYGVRTARIYGTPTAEVLADADALVDAGKLKVFVHRAYPLEQAVEALRDVETAKARGKIVLTISS